LNWIDVSRTPYTIKPSAKLQAGGRDSGALQAFGASLPTSSKVSAASLASRCLGEIGWALRPFIMWIGAQRAKLLLASGLTCNLSNEKAK
jgi:hypothetical protein